MMSVRNIKMFPSVSSLVLKSANKVSRYVLVSSSFSPINIPPYAGRGEQPELREVRLVPLRARLLLHALLPGVHGPGRRQQVPQTGGARPSIKAKKRNMALCPKTNLINILTARQGPCGQCFIDALSLFSARSSKGTRRAAPRSAPPSAWRRPSGASAPPGVSSTGGTPTAASCE